MHMQHAQWTEFSQKLREACPNFSEGWRAGGYRLGELENFGHAANGPPGGAGGNSGMLFLGMPIALTSGSIFYTGNSIFRP